MDRTPLLLEFRHKLAFHGGVHNTHTPRERAWLPRKLRDKHNSAPFSKGPRGKRKERKGHPLRDEPLRHDLEKRAKNRHRHSHIHSDVTLELARTELLLDQQAH